MLPIIGSFSSRPLVIVKLGMYRLYTIFPEQRKLERRPWDLANEWDSQQEAFIIQYIMKPQERRAYNRIKRKEVQVKVNELHAINHSLSFK